MGHLPEDDDESSSSSSSDGENETDGTRSSMSDNDEQLEEEIVTTYIPFRFYKIRFCAFLAFGPQRGEVWSGEIRIKVC